ncbi:MAG: hypothetical protein ABTQ25_00185 [Nitrosomonas ureae]
MTASNSAATAAAHNAAANATNQQTFVTIPKEEFIRIVWELKSIGITVSDLHEKLRSLRFGSEFVALEKNEVRAFCDVLHDVVFVNLEVIIEQLEQSDCSDMQKIGRHLRWYFDHIGFILNYLFPDPNAKSEHRPICKSDIESIFSLFDEILSGLYSYTDELENSIADYTKEDTYETLMTKRIKAIEPKFTALYDKYILPGGSLLLTDPQNLKRETEALRKEIWELQNQMPTESEEGMDCRMAIDQLDFLIRLIGAKFGFRKSDVIALSVIVNQASHEFSRALEWLEPADGGDLVDTVY